MPGPFEFQTIADRRSGASRRPRFHLQNRIGREAERDTRGQEMTPQLLNMQIAIEKDCIDRYFHAEGVDGLAGRNPKTSSSRKALDAEQTFATRGAIARYRDPLCDG